MPAPTPTHQAEEDVILKIRQVEKLYRSGFRALKGIDLDIRRGELFALLGPNGAGKTTLIGIICGLVRMTAGSVEVDGYDIHKQMRAARALIGLVPQELSTDAFETVLDTVNFSRGVFGKPRAPDRVEQVLRDLSLWDKRNSRIQELSGGMKRRVLIAKALAHEPRLLFLDEPTAGVDVELRKEMWQMVRGLRASGVTIILTTHYIEEAEEMADRIGVIREGELIVVEEKIALLQKLGHRELHLELKLPLKEIPPALRQPGLELSPDGSRLVYGFNTHRDGANGIPELLAQLDEQGIEFSDLRTKESSLEEIFVGLVEART